MCLRCDKNIKIDLISGVCDNNHQSTPLPVIESRETNWKSFWKANTSA